MDKTKILNLLKENGLSNIEEIEYKDNTLLVRFSYEFDDDEIEAAKAYSNDECTEDEEEGQIWFDEYFLPYLSDLAVDNTGDVIQDIMDSMNIQGQYVSYEMDEEEYEYNDFIAIFFENENKLDIEDVLQELEM